LALGRSGEALPLAFPIRSFRSDRVPKALDGRLSFYAFDISTPIVAGTYSAVRAAADTALTGATRLADGGERAVFSLCRPPGHHAGTDFYGGYCFINNAAVAAQHLIDRGAGKVAILDVDYHHGNGTQAIFYDRKDVLYASIHADPATDFPYFLGYADETGMGAGVGANRNFPLPVGSEWALYADALQGAETAVAKHRPDALVVSLGLDTLEGDPLSGFRLRADDFLRLGARIAGLGLPTLLVLEGGYALEEIGAMAVRVLQGFENA
jgi:acetoin utilization deacetylase AcuC-like enzyme